MVVKTLVEYKIIKNTDLIILSEKKITCVKYNNVFIFPVQLQLK